MASAVDTTATFDAPNDTTISWEYGRVINAVDDLDRDPDGNEPVQFDGVDCRTFGNDFRVIYSRVGK